jgi:hypothetical protein
VLQVSKKKTKKTERLNVKDENSNKKERSVEITVTTNGFAKEL